MGEQNTLCSYVCLVSTCVIHMSMCATVHCNSGWTLLMTSSPQWKDSWQIEMEVGLGINKALRWSSVGGCLQGDRVTVCVSGKRIWDRDSHAKIFIKEHFRGSSCESGGEGRDHGQTERLCCRPTKGSANSTGFYRKWMTLVLSQVSGKGSSLLICALITQSLDADCPGQKAKSWVRQFSLVEAISNETNSWRSSTDSTSSSWGGGVNASFLKRDQHIMAFSTVEFPKSPVENGVLLK